MKLIFTLGAVLLCLALPGGARAQTELPQPSPARPAGCDHVIEPGWFGKNAGVISDAISQAQDGARICIAAGEYEDALVVNRPVEIVGFGKTVPIIRSVTSADVVQWHADSGLIETVMLHQIGGTPSGSRVTGQNGASVFRVGQPDYFADDAHSGVTIVNSKAGDYVDADITGLE